MKNPNYYPPDEPRPCAYEDSSNQHIAAGKALKPECDCRKPIKGVVFINTCHEPVDYTKCPCGYHTHSTIQQGGRSWICSDPQCTEKSRFEAFNK